MIQSKPSDPVLGVLVEAQTYRNIGYLLLSFPLGLFYFVFLIVGITLGLSLTIVWIGIPILIGVLMLSRVFANFERQVTSKFLNLEIPLTNISIQGNFWQRTKSLTASPALYAEIFYLFSKFVLGTLSFALVVSLLSASLGLMMTPFFWDQWGWSVGIAGIWEVDSFSKAVATSVMGAILGVASLHVTNGLAWVYGEYTKNILGVENESFHAALENHSKSPL